MADTFGLSFSPTSQDTASKPFNAQTPTQDAIRLLSLRIPRVVGAGAPISGALLNAPGSAGMPAGMSIGSTPGTPQLSLEDILRKLFGQMMGTGTQPPSAAPSVPGVFNGPLPTPDIKGPAYTPPSGNFNGALPTPDVRGPSAAPQAPTQGPPVPRITPGSGTGHMAPAMPSAPQAAPVMPDLGYQDFSHDLFG